MTTLALTTIETGLIDPHPWNRKEFDRARLDELKEDIAANGIETPLSLREKEGGRFEIMKGERRWTVACELGLLDVPAFVAQKDDLSAYLLLLRDNLQREQLSPVQEAAGYHRLMGMVDAEGVAFTPEKIASSLSRSVDMVYKRLKLVHLPAMARQALEDGVIAEETAFLIGRLPTASMRQECTGIVLKGTGWGDHVRPMNRQETRDLIAEEFMVSLKGCPWDKGDGKLVPVENDSSGARICGGDCETCPSMARNNRAFAGDLGESKKAGKGGKVAGLDPLTCLHTACFRKKMEAHAKRAIAEAPKEGREVIPQKEAAKLFDAHRGDLKHDAKLERLSDKPGYEEMGHYDDSKTPTWGAIVKLAEKQDIKVPVKVVMNPVTKQLEELVDRQQMVEVARKVKPELFKKGGGSSKGTAAQTSARKAELAKQKLDKQMALEGMSQLRAKMAASVFGDEEWRMFLELALEHAGADGVKFFATWLNVPRPEKVNSGRDFLKPLMKQLEGEGLVQLQVLTVLALVSTGMRWQQTSCGDFRDLAKHFSVDLDEVKAAAKAALEKPAKVAKGTGKGDEGLVTRTRSKSAARNQASIIAAEKDGFNSEGGKGGKVLRSTDDYACDVCGARLEHPANNGILFATTPMGELLCSAHGGTWEPHRDICAREGRDPFWVDKKTSEYHCDGCGSVCIVPEHRWKTVDKMKAGSFKCTTCGGPWWPVPAEEQPQFVKEGKGKGTISVQELASELGLNEGDDDDVGKVKDDEPGWLKKKVAAKKAAKAKKKARS